MLQGDAVKNIQRSLDRLIDEIAKPMGLRIVRKDGIGTVIRDDRDAFTVRITADRQAEFDIDSSEIEAAELDNLYDNVVRKMEDVAVTFAADMLRKLPPDLRVKAIAGSETP
jgi:hypothetical protein